MSDKLLSKEKIYTVSYGQYDVFNIKIQATTEEEAIEQAREIDLGHWKYCGIADTLYQIEDRE